MFDTKKLALFLGGVVFGSAGFKVLSSKDAKKVHRRSSRIRLKKSSPQSRPHSDIAQQSRRFGRLFFTQRGKKSNEMYDLT